MGILVKRSTVERKCSFVETISFRFKGLLFLIVMKARNHTFSLTRVQWVIWLLLFGVNTLSMLRYDSLLQAMANAFVTISAYMLIVYGNAGWLLPAYYGKGRKLLYVLLALLLLFVVAAYRYGLGWWIYNTYFSTKPEPFKWANILTGLLSSLLIYFSSILFYITLHYFRLQEQQQEMQKKQVETELNLLKGQVQPHFLFNTLNNIYFYAQKESPVTASMLERLSHIMRYFVDEAPRPAIALSVELAFLQHYIELEKMRMRYPLEVRWREDATIRDLHVPPMLLIPLVENVFKHGIDKRRTDNFIDVNLSLESGNLLITVENALVQESPAAGRGTGLQNLRARLQLLFGNACEMHSEAVLEKGIYRAHLSIPV